MVNKKRANFFLSRPKKELQTLCRNYGIPSYKPKPYLAEALASLLPENFEIKNLINRGADTSCSQSAGPGLNGLDLNVVPRKPGKKGTHRMVNAPSTSKLPLGNAYIESVNFEEVSTPSFEFHVQSDAGINLFVDLNSTVSEWAESLNISVSLPQSSSCTKNQRLYDDVVRFGKSSSHLEDSHLVTQVETNVEHLPPVAPDSENEERISKDFVFLGRVDSSVKSCIEIVHTVDEGFSKATVESRALVVPNSGSCIQNPMPISASYPDPKADNIGDSLSNSVSDGAISFLTSEQPLKAIAEECTTSPVRFDCSPSYLGFAMHKSSNSASVKTQPLEAASFQKDDLLQCKPYETGSLCHDVNMASEQGDSAISSEVDHGTARNELIICPEKEERSSTAFEMEISECLGIEKSYKRNALVDIDSGKIPERQETDCVQGNGSNSLETWSSRKMNHLPGEVLPRRSMRELITCCQTT